MASARRVSLFEREVKVSLSPAALEVLFDHADVLSEGQVEAGRYFGSTMMTIDLARAQPRISEECDAGCARRVVELMPGDDQVRERARAIAVAEATRTAGALTAPAIDLHVRRDGARLRLDLDVEGAAPQRPSPAGRKP
ncbi:MAG: hypothetical protein H6709_15565 [Kofleriaceae bacterium]|nr:hypothetical protein [Myxococcales bacterium]MCB9561442.1 hypothetical protein [Kofleriaceae bacterium]MCB9573497.1 hypothetical protein [Kofleriaceae bacterium]